MSNIGSTALQTSKQEQTRTPEAGLPSAAQRGFMSGTRNMLEDARRVAENAIGQGAQLNPIIYQMLGLKPTMVDNSADLGAAREEYNAARDQFNSAQSQLDQLKALPKGKRSKQQKKQIRQLKKGLKQMQLSAENAEARYNELQTMPNQITGFEQMDPSEIDASSPFSSQNPLNQAQATQASRLNEYLAGGEVDPTLKQQWTSAEQALRAQLTQRFGPDYESTSVGQMALQNFSRDRNEAFATWNQQQVERYNNMAFGGAANLQQLLAGQIGLMREPGQAQMAGAANLSNLAPARLQQEQSNLQERAARQGMTINTTGSSPIGLVGSGLGALGQLATTPYNQQGDTLAGRLTGSNMAQPETIGVPSYGQAAATNALSNWAAGAGGTAAAEAAAGYGGYTAAEGATGLASWLF